MVVRPLVVAVAALPVVEPVIEAVVELAALVLATMPVAVAE